jgi:hypothetical protein
MLTDRQIAAIKPTSTRVEYVDEKVPGLALRVTPNGAKSWTVRYRHRGRLRRLTLGSASVNPLVQARVRVRDLLHAASKGGDPATEKQAGRSRRRSRAGLPSPRRGRPARAGPGADQVDHRGDVHLRMAILHAPFHLMG